MNILDFIIEFSAKGDRSVVRKASELHTKLAQADGAAVSLANHVGRDLKAAFMSLPGAQFFTNPIVALTAGIGTVAKLGMDTEKTARSFDVLVGSSEKAGDMLQEVYKYADETLWSRTDMSEAAQSLLAYSVPVEKVVKDLKMLGDISLGDKNKMATLASVFGQVSTAGRLLTQDYKQLLNVGFNPLVDISQMTGKSIATLQDEMSKGQISFEMFEKAVEHATGAGGKYENMITNLAGTTAGSFEQLKGGFVAVMLDIYDIIQPLVQAVLSGLNRVVGVLRTVIGWLSKIAPVLAVITSAVVAYNAVQLITNTLLNGWTIATRLQYFWLLLLEKAQWLLNAAMTANPIGIIVAAVAALVAAVVICWNKFEGFRAVVKTVWDTMKGFGGILKDFVIDRIKGIISGLGSMGEAIAQLFSGNFTEAWQAAKRGARELSGYDAVEKAVGATRDLAAGVKGNYQSHLAAEKISQPGVAGSGSASGVGTGAGSDGAIVKNADTITTGGTRNTEIKMTIGKLVESLNVSMQDATDTGELQDRIIECINRSLEIGLSAAR